ncbi:hypothetical protein Cantr_05757 [Candida viswanathii]|uniref:C2H2-type domain-containing protein n=1 Tax=Candida viswanathii TaxID=5486 RepID=A0A367XSK8_9ASCO|nr:hypothetical protein Cantr_05757 [Candida viswanathii]
MPKQNGPTLQPPFEIRKITSIKTANSVAKSRGSSGRRPPRPSLTTKTTGSDELGGQKLQLSSQRVSNEYYWLRQRADLRHHVHSDHLTHGLVSAQYTKYSAEIQKYLFVCDDPSCGKGFYRSDTLNRHIKLVHKRTSSHIRKRRKVSNNKSRT